MSNTTILAACLQAGRDGAKAENNIRKINEKLARDLAALHIQLPLSETDKAQIETFRVEYMVGALIGGRNYGDNRARHLANGANAKERSDDDKTVLATAAVNFMHVRERAGLKAPPKKRAPKASDGAGAGEPKASDSAFLTRKTCASVKEFLELFTGVHGLLLTTYDASAKVMNGDAASLLRAALVDMGDAAREAALALSAESARDVTPSAPALTPPTGVNKRKGKGRILEAQAA